MLENLLNSKTKKKLLGIFFGFPERSFALPELQEMMRSKSRVINQTLNDFLRSQIIVSASKKKKRYFKINPHFRLYQEVEDLVSDQKSEFEDLVVQQLKRLPNVRLAVLTGVFTLHPSLPVDLLLVGKGVSRLRVSNSLGNIGKIIGQEINYAIMDPQEYEHRKLMNDRFVRDILDNSHLVVIDNLK